MSSSKQHLTLENREVIEEGIRNGDSARKIALRINFNPSTVIREVKNNKTIRERKRYRASTNLSIRCVHYKDCQIIGKICKSCFSKFTACKSCRTKNCIDFCNNYSRKMCPKTKSWPYVCPEKCPKKAYCGYPKCLYNARNAFDLYLQRLSSTRQGIDISKKELADMDALISPLIYQGQSLEAIWLTHADKLPIGLRCAYNYQNLNLFSVCNLDHPRIAKCRPRKKYKNMSKRRRVDRTGRTYDDFLELPLCDQARVVQGDSVQGYKHNKNDILSLHIVSSGFQFYFLKKYADSKEVVKLFDLIEHELGTLEEFKSIFGILLLDRGIEFDNFEEIERSCLKKGEARCQVFYCDPMASNQKSQAERNHQQLRRILPKGRSDFDKLSKADVSICCSHVNSYPSAKRAGKCPFETTLGVIPQDFLDAYSFVKLPRDKVILKPYIMKHAVTL